MSAPCWNEVRIGDVGEVFTGRTPPTERLSYFGNTYPFITPGDMHQGKYARVTSRSLSQEGADLLKRITLPAKSICVSCIGWQMGEVIMTAVESFTNQQINTIVPKPEINPDFLYYSLLPRKQELLSLGSSTGVRTPILNKSAFCDLKLFLPDQATQKRIASILSAYDDLIENNQRRIKILEDMARKLYREWFVYFRYPGHENHKLVDSPLGMVPEGWGVSTVAEAFAISGGGTPSREKEEFWENGTIQWYSPTDLTRSGTMFMDDSSDHITEQGLAGSSARLFPAYSVMLTSRATIGAISINTHEACTNQGFITCLPNKRIPLYFLYHWLAENVPTFQRMASGATFKEISRGVFKTIEFLQPDDGLVNRFEGAVSPLAEQALTLQREIKNLRRTRDLLLPRLLSGQVDVSQIELDAESLAALEQAATIPAAATAKPAAVRSAKSNEPEPATEPSPATAAKPISEYSTEELLCAIRKVFSDGAERDKETATRDVARELGFARTGSRISEAMNSPLRTAVRRGILTNNRGLYSLGFRSWSDCTREWQKDSFTAAIGSRNWYTRDEAIRAFARWGGFARTGDVIDQIARSVINGLIRDGRLETNGPELVRIRQ